MAVPLRRRRRWALTGALLLFAALFAGWVGVRLSQRDGGGGASAGPALAHVHGLGVNPADGALYVATHHGTFRLPEGGPPERVGSSSQDTMGFTVAGPDRFLGSGHPDVAGMQAGQPGRLGLIESSDAGRSWSNRSLAGEVDFHALAYAHGQVYGWDAASARLMVSADAQAWETRTQMPMHAFVVDPSDAEGLVAAVPGGLLRSGDGGRSWSRLPGPELVALSWSADGVLWGLALDGAVLRSGDGGQEWQPAGHLPGQAEALSAAPDAVWAAAAAEPGGPTGIYRSLDQGRTWELRYRDRD